MAHLPDIGVAFGSNIMKQLLIVLLLLGMFVPPVSAKEISLLAGLCLPPYIIPESNNGMEYDIVKEALAKKGHLLKLRLVPFIRVIVDYAKYDGAITINEASGVKGYYSDVVITYQNYAISLKDKKISINKIQDLGNKKIVAFQNATKYLKDRYKTVVMSNPHYIEMANQESQVKMLFSGRTDAVVMDCNIFKYYRKKVFDMDAGAEVVYHEIFPGSDYKVLFNNQTLRDEFNQALDELKSSGRYQQIVNSYIQ